MASSIDAARGADLLLSYVFPAGIDLSGFDAGFTVYAARNGSSLLHVGTTANGHGSVVTAGANLMSLNIKAADIDGLPVNADDSQVPAALWFDLIVTTTVPDVVKLHGGQMRVLPFGARLEPFEGAIDVGLNGQSVAIEIAQSGFDTAVLAAAQGFAGDAEGAAATAAGSAVTASNACVVAAGSASAASGFAAAAGVSAGQAAASAVSAAGSAAAASGASATAVSQAAVASTSATNSATSAIAAAGSAIQAATNAAQLGAAIPLTGYDRSGYIAGEIDDADNILWAVTNAGVFALGNGGDIVASVTASSTAISTINSSLSQLLPTLDFSRNATYAAGLVDAADNIIWAVTAAGSLILGNGGDINGRVTGLETSVATLTPLLLVAPISGYDRSGYIVGLIDASDNIIWAVDAAGIFYTSTGAPSASLTAQSEGRAQKLRRLMSQAEFNNPVINPLLIGQAPFPASGTAVITGQQFSSTGRVYECSSGGNVGLAPIGRGYGLTSGGAAFDYVGQQTSPAITLASSVPIDLTQSVPASISSTILRFGGGVPTAWPGRTGNVGCWAANHGINGTGNFQNGDGVSVPALNVTGHFMELKTDSSRVCFVVDYNSGVGVNILVSEESGYTPRGFKYFNQLPFAPNVNGSGKCYIVLDFTGVSPTTNHPANGRMRRVRIETGGAVGFYGVYLLPIATACAVPLAGRSVLLQIGDSWTEANTGAVFAVGNRLGPAEVCGWMAGFDEVIASGVSSTGYNKTSVACPRNFQQRAADLLGYVNPDLIQFLGSVNDLVNAGAQQAAVQTCIANIRAVNPYVPIVFFGENYSSYVPGGNSNAITMENATAAGVATSGDARSYFVPVQTDLNPFLVGTGNSTAPGGNGNVDTYVNGAAHLLEAGNTYYGGRMSAPIKKIIQDATWVQ